MFSKKKINFLVTCDVIVCHERHPFLCHPLGHIKNITRQLIYSRKARKPAKNLYLLFSYIKLELE